VDSFLQERREATQSWEITQVNEILTQMESCSGVFIATTNLMDGLDAAALRRFDLKARFEYLTPEQAWALLRRQCSHLELPPPEAALRKHLGRLDLLTPGDFAAVIRRHRFQPMVSALGLVEALEGECALKQGHKSAIGFV
jgi:SpoVK/Ycf46/Vps4 family AAA+-type ATPase